MPCYKLFDMILREIIYNEEEFGKGRVWCVEDESKQGGEFTVCGNPIAEGMSDIPDSEGLTNYYVTGRTKKKGKVTCPDCRSIISWFKQLPKNCL